MPLNSPLFHFTDFQALAAHLPEALSAPLPGEAAQSLMSPTPRPVFAEDLAGSRPAAGLLLFFPRDGRPHLLLTVRSHDLPHHRGQVALPGGLVDDGESLEEAALRETLEEVGVPATEIRLLGRLSPLFIPVSGFLLHPFVGICERPPETRINPAEVTAIIEVPLADLAGPEHLRVETREIAGAARRIPYFALGEHKLWGATAMILAELLWILSAPPHRHKPIKDNGLPGETP